MRFFQLWIKTNNEIRKIKIKILAIYQLGRFSFQFSQSPLGYKYINIKWGQSDQISKIIVQSKPLIKRNAAATLAWTGLLSSNRNGNTVLSLQTSILPTPSIFAYSQTCACRSVSQIHALFSWLSYSSSFLQVPILKFLPFFFHAQIHVLHSLFVFQFSFFLFIFVNILKLSNIRL